MTRALLERFIVGEKEVVSRGEGWKTKFFYALWGMVLLPFIHPIFTRYLPILSTLRRNHIFLNFSQTFGCLFFHRNATIIIHDLQCHRPHTFLAWVILSERILLKRALKIVTLTERDAKYVRRFYKVDQKKVQCIFENAFGQIAAFRKTVGKRKKIVFIGSLAREENYVGVTWFVKNILNRIPYELVIVGSYDAQFLKNDKIFYERYVQDLDLYLKNFSVAIAPMFTSQGVKVKIVEALLAGLPVLSTKSGISGLTGIPKTFVSNDPKTWVEILSGDIDFEFEGIPNKSKNAGNNNRAVNNRLLTKS